MILTGKIEAPGQILSHCVFIHHKSHMDWPGIEASKAV